MANIQVKLRRGTEAEHDTTSGGFTGAEGEVTVDTTNDTLRVHDGSTVGGVRLAKHSELSAGGGGTVTSVGTGAGLSGGPITTSGTLSLATIPNMKVLGNTAGFNTFPTSVSILDEDDMASDSDTELATQQSIKAYVDSQAGGIPSSKRFVSGATVFPTTNTTTSWTHSLGQIPDIIHLILRCTTIEGGYSVGDEVQFTTVSTAGGRATLHADSSSIYLAYYINAASPFYLDTKNATNSAFYADPAKWRIIIRAFVF